MAKKTNKPLTDTVKGGKVVVVDHVDNLIMEGDDRSNASSSKKDPRPRPSNLPPLSVHIVERPDEIRRIHESLASSGDGTVGIVRSAAATADGGYGKTIAALLYAHKHEADYPGGRFFIRCEQGGGAIVGELAALAHFFGINRELNDAEKAAAVKIAIEAGPPALLILDNVVNGQQLMGDEFRTALPRGNARHLITTRATDLPDVTEVHIGRLTTAQAVEMLGRFRSDARDAANVKAAESLVEQVEGLAVAIAAIGAYMKLVRQATWTGYAADLKKHGLSMIDAADNRVASHIGYSKSVVKSLDDAVDALPPAERRVLEHAALLPADLAPRPWLVDLLTQDQSITLTAKPGVEMPPAEAVIARLIDLDLLRTSAEETRLMSMHRAHRARLVERLQADEARRSALLDAITALGESRGEVSHNAVTDQSIRWELTPLAALAGSLAEQGRLAAGVSLANRIHTALHSLGRHAENRSSLDRFACDADATLAAAGDIEFATLLSNLAVTKEDQGDLPGARTSMEQSIEIDQKHFPDDHPRFAIRYSNFAMIQQDQGDLSGARANMERAIEITRKHFPADHPSFATNYSNLATIQRDQGDLPGARASMERAIEIDRKHFPEDHPAFATRYSNLAMIQQDQGDLPGARASMERAIEIGQKHFHENHPAFATRYSNLALIQQDQGDLPGARASMERSIKIDQKHFPDNHPTFAISYSNLAMIQQDQGDLPGARASMDRAIEITRKHFSADHPTFATRYSNLATIQQKQGDLPGARASMERAIEIGQKHFPENHPAFATRYNNLSHILWDLGEREEALGMQERAIVILTKHFGPEHPHRCMCDVMLAQMKAAMGR